MPSCSAPDCTNRSKDCPEKSFYRLPCQSKKEQRQGWLAKIKRSIIPAEMYICSDHFEPDCFERDLKVMTFLMNYTFCKCNFLRLLFEPKHLIRKM